MKRYLFVLLLTVTVAHGQVDSTFTDSLPARQTFRFGVSTELGTALTFTNLPEFRSFLRSNQITPPPIYGNSFVFNFGVRINRVKVLAQHNLLLINIGASSPNGWVVRSQGASYTGLSVGFDLLNNRNRRLYVGGGLGGFNTDFNLYRRATQPVSFGSVLQTVPAGSVPSLRLIGAGCVDVYLEYGQREKRNRSVESVIRLGYRRGTTRRSWESDAYTFTNPITERVSQVYLQATIAFSVNSNRFLQIYTRRPTP
ncbi:hypothetical protein [Spirosoma montaniterrae]|uniref:Outer membrane protein beta-barrel domain-containing protein n=1 Tax=Spirosoma montaniterrae TaxID=1178516 RepID=A0A1P9WYG3_9BACT|nr:hypothetical protein [Spirosoma montaniterrae]AQG80421.1 hypothetical protein AWR27_14470 [Spirosoma montaniterrae]